MNPTIPLFEKLPYHTAKGYEFTYPMQYIDILLILNTVTPWRQKHTYRVVALHQKGWIMSLETVCSTPARANNKPSIIRPAYRLRCNAGLIAPLTSPGPVLSLIPISQLEGR
jgi:hypothetical protein